MKTYRVWFERTYTITEGFDREVKAENFAEAQTLGEDLARGFDLHCPDDCSETGGYGAGEFQIDDIQEIETQETP
jgi:hypothetical protein